MHAIVVHGWRPLVSLAVTAAVYTLAPSAEPLRTGLALFALIGSLWMTQALHISVTALLVPLLYVLTGVFTVKEALASFANPVIFLFLGGFALAAALARHGLDRALAIGVLRLARGRRALAFVLLFALTAALSMWISNTATAAMMLPLALGLLQRQGRQAEEEAGAALRDRVFVLLGLAYSASIGGIGTLVGSPPNAIAAAQAGIGFAQWLRIGLPMVGLLLPLMVGVLYLLLRPSLAGRSEVPHERFEWTRPRLAAICIFGLTVVGWVGSAPLSRWLGVEADFDTLVALAAIAALFVTRTLRWDDLESGANWGVLLLFGGGLALSHMMGSTGASRFLADQLVAFVHGAPPLLLLVAVVAFVVMLTELVSNTASAALLVPIFLSVSGSLGMSPAALAAAIAVSASCAFMLPVATPPNAIVYGTGEVPQGWMMRCGLVLNLVCIVVISAVVSFAL
nr:DASS family sodium-coupled anion symporter [uncultured Caldimonas sp.]